MVWQASKVHMLLENHKAVVPVNGLDSPVLQPREEIAMMGRCRIKTGIVGMMLVLRIIMARLDCNCSPMRQIFESG